MKTRIVNPTPLPQTIHIAGKRTSVRLEDEMWDALNEISAEQNQSVDDLLTHIKSTHAEANFASGVRVYIVMHYRAKARGR